MPVNIQASAATSRGESRQSLCAADLGRWLVETQHSTHVWDVQPDRVLYRRLPGEASSSFTADGVEVHVTRVDRWPAVGATSLIWFDDLDMPELVEQYRRSSTVKSITRLVDDPRAAVETEPEGTR